MSGSSRSSSSPSTTPADGEEDTRSPTPSSSTHTPTPGAGNASPYHNGFHPHSQSPSLQSSPYTPSPAPGTPCSTTGAQTPGAGGEMYVKRPLNAYMIWTRGARKKILAKDPKMKMNDVSRAMGEIWKSMSDKEKKPYFDQAKKNKLQHKQDYPNYSYQPQRKKQPKNATNAGAGGAHNGGTTPNRVAAGIAATAAASAASPLMTQLNKDAHLPKMVNGYTPAAAPPGTLPGASSQIVTALGTKAPTSGNLIHSIAICPYAQRVPGPPPPPTMQSALENYYSSLCQPAFGERPLPPTMPPPQFYLEQYQQLQYQAHMQMQQHNMHHNGGGYAHM